MNILTYAQVGILMFSTISTSYPHNVLISSELVVENKISVVETVREKDYKYLKENIKIPQLKSELSNGRIQNVNAVINDDIMSKVTEAERTAKEYFSEVNGMELPNIPFDIYSMYHVTLDSSRLISMYNDYYEYLGGAHGMTTRTSYTLDKKEIHLLELQDLFVSGYDYKKIIDDEIKKQIQKNKEMYFDEGKDFKGISDNQAYYIEGDNLVIYYQLYELAPYVAGIPEFKIPLKSFGKNYLF